MFCRKGDGGSFPPYRSSKMRTGFTLTIVALFYGYYQSLCGSNEIWRLNSNVIIKIMREKFLGIKMEILEILKIRLLI